MRQKRLELIIITTLLSGCLLAGLWLYRPRTGAAIAIITADSTERYRIDLSKAENGTFALDDQPVSFEVLDGKIRFVNVTCPDHICEKAGWCENPGDRAVCLPNRTTLICYDASEL